MSGFAASAPASIEFNPLSPATLANPYPIYDRLRATAPVFRTSFGPWFITRHEDVAFVLRDRRFGRAYNEEAQKRYGPEALNEPALAAISRMMLFLDPPDHTRVRSLVASAFAAKRIEGLRSDIQALADRLLDDVAERGQMDVVNDFAFRLPIWVICDLIGIPEEDRTPFLKSFRIASRMLEALPLSRTEMDEANAQVVFLNGYFGKLFQLRQCEPRGDLATHLVQAEGGGKKITREELTANVILLFGAGFETTTNLIGNALLALHRHPAELARLKGQPSLLGSALDELLRYGAPVQFTVRKALESAVIGETEIRAGESIMVGIGAASRDPAVYPNPHRLLLSRKGVRPLAFGGGIHFCLGAQLGRIELEVALSTILRRFPSLQLHGVDSPKWRSSFVLRGLESLPATW